MEADATESSISLSGQQYGNDCLPVALPYFSLWYKGLGGKGGESPTADGKSGNLQEGKNVCPLPLSSILRSRASGTVDVKHCTVVSVEKQHEYLIVPLSARISLRLCVCELS